MSFITYQLLLLDTLLFIIFSEKDGQGEKKRGGGVDMWSGQEWPMAKVEAGVIIPFIVTVFVALHLTLSYNT